MALHLKSTGIDFIDFGQTTVGTSTMANELMDDYEEGTFTPAPGQGSVSLSAAQAYVKIGQLVNCRGYVYGNAHTTDTATWALVGFPFACVAEAYGSAIYHDMDVIPTAGNVLTSTVYMPNTTSQLQGLHSVDNAAWVNFKYPEHGTAFNVGFHIAYFAAS